MIDYKDFIKEDESIDDLELDNLYILQKRKGFRFGIDAVLLSHFANVKNKDRVIDLCSGTGIVAILIAGKTKSQNIVGLEIQEKYYDMANRSVLMNKIDDRVKMVLGDVKDIKLMKSLGIFDVVTVNPPYKKDLSGIKNEDESLKIARHEILLNLDDVVRASSVLLKDMGRLCMVHRPERLIEIIDTFRKYKIEPKRIRMVAPKEGREANIVLVEGFKGQKPNLKWESELKVYNEDGTYSKEIKEIYGDNRHE